MTYDYDMTNNQLDIKTQLTVPCRCWSTSCPCPGVQLYGLVWMLPPPPHPRSPGCWRWAPWRWRSPALWSAPARSCWTAHTSRTQTGTCWSGRRCGWNMIGGIFFFLVLDFILDCLKNYIRVQYSTKLWRPCLSTQCPGLCIVLYVSPTH